MSGTKLRKQQHRRNYSDDFKREALTTYEESGKSLVDLWSKSINELLQE